MTQKPDHLQDISDRLSEQLIVDPRLFEQMIDSMPDGFLVINEAGVIQFVNRQIELMFGYPRIALRGQLVHVLLSPDLREAHAQHIARFFERPVSRPMNFAKALPGHRQNGRTIMVAINLAPLVSDQGVLAMGVVREVRDGNQDPR